MNHRLIASYIGRFVVAIALLMLIPAAWAIWFQEWRALESFLFAAVTAVVIGGLLLLVGRGHPPQLFQREALSLVSGSWIVIAAVGALPYIYDGDLNVVDAYFESVSGFTTTGATVITDIEATPKSLLFWRSMTHWLGGLGIVLLFIAVLPYLGAGGKQLFRSESTGPDPRGLRPRIQDTASILYKIYFGFTLVETLALMLAGMSFYDALCHTFGTIATGGFSTKQASIAHYDSAAIDTIIIVFMVIAGTNFSLYFAMTAGDWTAPFRNTEWRVYIALLLMGTVLVTWNISWAPWTGEGPSPAYSLETAFRNGAFQVVSIMTTTGYATDDFNDWPYFSRMVLVCLMFIGGCAGSTGGGMKVVRIIVLAKMAYARVEKTFRPKRIRLIRIDGEIIDNEVQTTVFAFFVLGLATFFVGCLVMSAVGLPFETAATSVIATLNNIGPGLELVGATQDYHHIPVVGKLFLIFCMILGRLELFSVFVLLVPAFWRHS